MRRVKRWISDVNYIFLNCFIMNIPSWYIRKFILKIYGLKIGKGSRIGIGTTIVDPKKITIGNRTIINEKCHIDGRGELIIGDDTSISFGTTIITASHKANDNFEYYSKKTIINNHVWIGAKAIILDGSFISDLCIIGAGAVLRGKTEEKGIYVGNPIKKIKTREDKGEYKLNYKPFFR